MIFQSLGNLPLLEHSENKITSFLGNEVGPGVLNSSDRQTQTLQEFQTMKTESRDSG